MKKLIFLLMLLVLANILCFVYLKDITFNSDSIIITDTNKPLIYQKKDIVLNDVEDFIFDDYFKVLSFNEYVVDYKFDENKLNIKLNYLDSIYEYSYNYQIIEPIVIEKEVIKEVYVHDVADNQNSRVQTTTIQDDYFNIGSTYYSFSSGTDLNNIISTIVSSVDTNMQVTVDYSQLNPNVIGQYSVFFITSMQNYEIIVNIT